MSENTMFPNCLLHFCEQRTDEWFELRKGVLTASEFGPWLVGSGKVADRARKAACCKKLAEIAGCDMGPNVENYWMKRGTEMEPEAVQAFQDATGLALMPVGFALGMRGIVGCSPDGLLCDANTGFEGKCPRPDTHIGYLLDGCLPEKYSWQVHGSMAVTGADSWWFQSYCPGLPALRVLVGRDDFTEEILEGLHRYAEEFAELKNRLAGIWDNERI